MMNFTLNITGIVILGLVKTLFFFDMLKLYILRHGKAVKFKSNDTDFQRQLNKKGTAQINLMGYQLQQENIRPDLILASGAQRTTETAEIMQHHLHAGKLVFDDELYLTDKDSLREAISSQTNCSSILLVGHNYGLSDFLNYCCNENITLSTGMFAEINFNFNEWELISADTGELVRTVVPNVHSF